MFDKICRVFGTPQIDLFANRLNYKLQKFVSFQHDPLAWRQDAFAMDWSVLFLYAFPPFNQILKCVQKLKCEKCHFVLVVPDWPTQPWYSEVFAMTDDYFSFHGREVTRLDPQERPVTQKFYALNIRVH